MGKIKKDIHTHTIYSRGFGKYGHHAQSTMQENCEKALEKGLRVLGISDHGPGHKFYGINKKDRERILDDRKRLKEYYAPKGLDLLLGMETNLTGWNGETDLTEAWEKELDYVLMGYHYAAAPSNFKSGVDMFIMNPSAKFFKLGKVRTKEKNTEAYIKAIERYPIWGITHPGDKIDVDILELARACKKHGVKLEINSYHQRLNIEDIILIKDFFKDFFVGSDAHNCNRIGDVAGAENICSEAELELENIWNYKE